MKKCIAFWLAKTRLNLISAMWQGVTSRLCPKILSIKKNRKPTCAALMLFSDPLWRRLELFWVCELHPASVVWCGGEGGAGLSCWLATTTSLQKRIPNNSSSSRPYLEEKKVHFRNCEHRRSLEMPLHLLGTLWLGWPLFDRRTEFCCSSIEWKELLFKILNIQELK